MDKEQCPICRGGKFSQIADRNRIAPYQNRTYTSKDAAISCIKRDINLVMCEDCGFVFNKVFDESIDLYDGDYNNTQSNSDLFLEYMRSSIQYLKDRYVDEKLDLSKIVEIGCGKNAEYLRMLKECFDKDDVECEFVGYDPSYADMQEKIRNFTIYPEYFDLDHSGKLDADLLVSRHVIEHISEPLELLKNVNGLKQNRQATAFVETPDVTWILKNRVVFDFSYEHCSLFAPVSMYRAAKEVGASVKEVLPAFGDQYMWTFLKKDEAIDVDTTRMLHNLLHEAEAYVKDEKKIITYIENWLENNKNNKTAVWGAAGKGNIFLNMFDPNAELINYVIDSNRWKDGRYIAGTGHRIYSPQILNKDKELRCIVVMNGNYYSEIQKAVQDMGCDIDIIDIDYLLSEAVK